MFEFDGILLKPCLLQPYLHVVGVRGADFASRGHEGSRVAWGSEEFSLPRIRKPPCHMLPPSEIPWRLFLAVLQAQKGNTYFTELAERVEYGNYGQKHEIAWSDQRTAIISPLLRIGLDPGGWLVLSFVSLYHYISDLFPLHHLL